MPGCRSAYAIQNKWSLAWPVSSPDQCPYLRLFPLVTGLSFVIHFYYSVQYVLYVVRSTRLLEEFDPE